MRKIVLFCAQGMSTSLLVNKMQEAAAKQGYECDIAAYALTTAKDTGADADIIVLGPQVKFSRKLVEQNCPGKTIIDVDMRAYGTMDGEAVLEQVQKTLGDK